MHYENYDCTFSSSQYMYAWTQIAIYYIIRNVLSLHVWLHAIVSFLSTITAIVDDVQLFFSLNFYAESSSKKIIRPARTAQLC